MGIPSSPPPPDGRTLGRKTKWIPDFCFPLYDENDLVKPITKTQHEKIRYIEVIKAAAQRIAKSVLLYFKT